MNKAVIGVAAAAIASAALGGCVKKSDDGFFSDGSHRARYLGVGHFTPGPAWSKLVRADAPKDPASAKTGDDEQVIIVMDGVTGELRQCGNLSGYCIGMNPWAKPLVATQSVPVAIDRREEETPPQGAAPK
jgi:hypothetical protein